MENFNHLDNFMNLATSPEVQYPPADTNLAGFPFLPLDDAFDINSCLPQIPFYEPPFADVGSHEIACSSSEQDGGSHHHHHAHQSASPTKTGTQPSRLLISERNRRGRMKEKLLALRSLVPNITKMDNASIIGDATSYVQELQKEATKLSEEIAQLDSGQSGGGSEVDLDAAKQDTNIDEESAHHKILQMDVIHIDNYEFYIKIICKEAKGVMVAILQVIESLKHVIIETSNLAVHGDYITLSFTIHVMECSKEINEAALKLSLSSSFINQGFDLPPELHTSSIR